MSDYFQIDPTKRKKNQQQSQQNQQSNSSTNQEPEESVQEENEESSPEQSPERETQESGQTKQEQETGEKGNNSKTQNESKEAEEESSPEQNVEQELQESEQSEEEQKRGQTKQEQETGEKENNSENQNESKEAEEESSPEQNVEQELRESEQSEEEQKSGQTKQEQETGEKENNSENQNESKEAEEESSLRQDSKQQEENGDENDFDDLMDNYDEDNKGERDSSNNTGNCSPSGKLSNINVTHIYKTLKKLVSISYETYQKGTYKYNKKEIVKHYLTNQKFRILDDMMSPTFKPDIYVFDLSPSNDDSLEMYVNAISSVAIKGSLIYLTYNEQILRKLEIKKPPTRGIDVNKVARDEVKKYNDFDCTIYKEYQTIYQELHSIKDRKIYIFSDYDISSDISKLSQENPEIVWFSTEKNHGNSGFDFFFYREYPKSYIGYYVATQGIEDIEKYIEEKNKKKYKRRNI